MTIATTSRVTAIIGGLVSLGIFLATADLLAPMESDYSTIFPSAAAALAMKALSLVMVALFPLWIVCPFILFYRRSSALAGFPILSSLFLAAGLLAVASSAYYYWTISIVAANPDPQDGLVYVFLPLYQVTGIFFAAEICGAIKRFERRRLERRGPED